ncbi:hypothetical protein E4665_02610 [Sporolactobacillus shoreae]|uniref:Uncharacterized protein n=1 Tax=Sporolactobacillus shoreae TaxID=1465501 RepID=A0A4Z0GSF5_9BACL|nr:hypothetical protein [Sporolactobacillus shoreae]TGA99857.1 hypothetical protein E4665_02610 [Sporolactobacillus shoreae]
MKTSRILKWVSGGFEALLGFPILGGSIIIGMLWTPLLIALALHIVTLIFSIQDRTRYHGSVLGIITSIIGVIPFVGMIMHIITAVLLFVNAGTEKD